MALLYESRVNAVRSDVGPWGYSVWIRGLLRRAAHWMVER